MIITLFMMLLAVVVFLLYFGYQRSQMFLVIVGFAFMFLMGMNVLSTGLSYPIGENTTSYVDTNITYTTTLTNYETYTNHTLSFLFVFVAAAGGIVSMLQLKGGKE